MNQGRTCLVDDLVEYGHHVAQMFGGDDGVEHLALSLVLLSCCATRLVSHDIGTLGKSDLGCREVLARV